MYQRHVPFVESATWIRTLVPLVRDERIQGNEAASCPSQLEHMKCVDLMQVDGCALAAKLLYSILH